MNDAIDESMVNRIVLAFLQQVAFDIVARTVEDADGGGSVLESFPFRPDEITMALKDREVIADSYGILKTKHSFLKSEIEAKRRWLFWLIESEKPEDIEW